MEQEAHLVSEKYQPYLSIFEQITPIFWGRKRFEYEIYQGYEHSRHVTKHLIHLIKEIPSHLKLSDIETFLLLASAQLYEVGLQISGEDNEDKERNLIRRVDLAKRNHLTEQLIMAESETALLLGLGSVPFSLKRGIAQICRYCSEEEFLLAPKEIAIDNEGVRIRSLSALLALADQLYITSFRVNWNYISKLPLEERGKWWCYHYIQVTPVEKGKLKFFYQIPDGFQSAEGFLKQRFEKPFQYSEHKIVNYLWNTLEIKLTTDSVVNIVEPDPSCPGFPADIWDYLGGESKPVKDLQEALNPEIEDFEIIIDLAGWIYARSAQGEAKSETQFILTDRIGTLSKKINQDLSRKTTIKELGIELFRAVFQREIYSLWKMTERIAIQNNNKIRVRLAVENEAITNLPFEAMYWEDRGYFLSINPDVIFSRYLRLTYPSDLEKGLERPIKVLLIIADPPDQRVRVNGDEWVHSINDALERNKNLFTTKVVSNATYKNIRAALQQCEPQVIQFIGHGKFHHGKGYVALVEDSTMSTWWVDEESFADILSGHTKKLKLVSLASCESARTNSFSGFSGTSSKLIQRGIPAVIAMQYPIPVFAAKLLLENLFSYIGSQYPIDWSVQEARKALAVRLGSEKRFFITPVLFMRSTDGKL